MFYTCGQTSLFTTAGGHTLLLLSFQLRNHNRVKAPTAERAASLLDSAVAARRRSDFVTYLSDSSIMFFTLHIQPPRAESSTVGKGGDPFSSRLRGHAISHQLFSGQA